MPEVGPAPYPPSLVVLPDQVIGEGAMGFLINDRVPGLLLIPFREICFFHRDRAGAFSLLG